MPIHFSILPSSTSNFIQQPHTQNMNNGTQTTDLNTILASRKRKQFTRKDLDLDSDDKNYQLNLNSMDFLKPTSLKLNQLSQLDDLSSSSSQASSTVINPNFKDESQKVTNNLSNMNLKTIDFNGIIANSNATKPQSPLPPVKSVPETQQSQEELQEQHIEPQPFLDLGDDDDMDDDDYFDDDKLNDYLNGMLPSPPSSPPRELDPSKLYALYDFSGPDPSHLELRKDDAVSLLNDTDAYWWLVKRLSDAVVGFAPAEILETYGERLARLNCWKNEVIERNDDELTNTYLSQDDLRLFHLNSQRQYSNNSYPPPIPSNDLNTTPTKGDSNLTLNEKGAIESQNSILDSSKSELSLLGRKSSLKRSKNSTKKSVAFVPELTLQDIDEDGRSEVLSEANFERDGHVPLVVTKTRASNTNFMIKNLDDYKGNNDNELMSHHNGSSATTDSESVKTPNSFQENTDGKFGPPVANFMATNDSIGSYSPSTSEDLEEEEDDLNDDDEIDSVSRVRPFRTLSFGESRAKFLEHKPSNPNLSTSANTTLDEQQNTTIESIHDSIISKITPKQQQQQIVSSGEFQDFSKPKTSYSKDQATVTASSDSLQVLNDLLASDSDFDDSFNVSTDHFHDAKESNSKSSSISVVSNTKSLSHSSSSFDALNKIGEFDTSSRSRSDSRKNSVDKLRSAHSSFSSSTSSRETPSTPADLAATTRDTANTRQRESDVSTDSAISASSISTTTVSPAFSSTSSASNKSTNSDNNTSYTSSYSGSVPTTSESLPDEFNKAVMNTSIDDREVDSIKTMSTTSSTLTSNTSTTLHQTTSNEQLNRPKANKAQVYYPASKLQQREYRGHHHPGPVVKTTIITPTADTFSIPKTRSNRSVSTPIQSQSQSNDLHNKLNGSSNSSTSSYGSIGSGNGDGLVGTRSRSESSIVDIDKMHPVTKEVFNPLFDQLNELEQLLNDYIVG